LFRWPGTRQEFWRSKIAANVERDRRNLVALLDAGWRVAEIWECQLKGRDRQEPEVVIGTLAAFLESSDRCCVIGVDQAVTVSEEA
jgi:DNA mismatch endonuclease (patch repair protein)